MGETNPGDIQPADLQDVLPDADEATLREVADRINQTEASPTDIAEALLDDPDGYTPGADDPEN